MGIRDGWSRVAIESHDPEDRRRPVPDQARSSATGSSWKPTSLPTATTWSGVLLHRRDEGDAEWTEMPMEPLGYDRSRGEFTVDAIGRYRYTLQAWVDRFHTWVRDLGKRARAGQDVTVELLIGVG